MTEFIIPTDDTPAPIRMGEVKRRNLKGGGSIIQAQVFCKSFRTDDELIDFLCKNTEYQNWIINDGDWKDEEFFWFLYAKDEEQ